MKRSSLERPLSVLAVTLCAYMVYAAFFGPYKTTIVHRAIFLGVMLVIFFWSIRPLGTSPLATLADGLLVAGSVLSTGYIVIFWQDILAALGGPFLTTFQLIVGSILILVVLESVRRISPGLLILALTSLAYTMFGNYVPGVLGHAGVDFKRIVYLTAFSHEGIFGLGLDVAATYLFAFILFSTSLQQTGAADFFFSITNAFVGRARGAPAKCAVVASGLCGTVSGSSIANVVTIGSFTIPLMKKMGFQPAVAGAIEVLSSEGGQLMPPIMGAGAFLMAELTGIPYWSIALAAIFPALLYYLSAFIVVDCEAAKLGMKGSKDSESKREKWFAFLDGWHYLAALLMLFYLLLVSRLTATVCGIIVTFLLILFTEMRPSKRMNFRRILSVFDIGTRGAAEMTLLIASVGLVQQAFTVTGLAQTLSDMLVAVAGASPLLMLLMAMAITTILGMGMPTPIAYLLAAVFVAPAMVHVGFPRLASHLFLFFFAIKSGSTPPVAVVAVVAAGIAGANWWKTAWKAFVYSLPGFCVAYAFMYHTEYLMQGAWPNILANTVSGIIGTAGVAFAMQGYLFSRMNIATAALLAVASWVMVVTSILPTAIAFVFVLTVVLLQWKKAAGEGRKWVEAVPEKITLSDGG